MQSGPSSACGTLITAQSSAVDNTLIRLKCRQHGSRVVSFFFFDYVSVRQVLSIKACYVRGNYIAILAS